MWRKGRQSQRSFVGLAVVLLLVLPGGTASAQDSMARPLSEDLERIRDDDDWLLLATRRCSALFIVMAELRRGVGDPDTGEMYIGWSKGFEALALMTAERIGRGWDLRNVPQVNEREIRRTADRMIERVSFVRGLANDPVLPSDLRTCRDLVDELQL